MGVEVTDIVRAGELALRLRNAIVAAVREGHLESRQFNAFPRGVCGYSSQMLGQYLQDSGLGVWNYRSGVDETGQTHAWIERDGWIIDITAAQFEGIDDDALVTRDQSFHRRFARIPSYPHADLSIDGSTMPALRRDYVLLRDRADRDD